MVLDWRLCAVKGGSVQDLYYREKEERESGKTGRRLLH